MNTSNYNGHINRMDCYNIKFRIINNTNEYTKMVYVL